MAPCRKPETSPACREAGQVLAVRAVELLRLANDVAGTPASVVVEDVRSSLPGSPFAHAGSLAQTLARSRATLRPRVVPRGFLVHGLKPRVSPFWSRRKYAPPVPELASCSRLPIREPLPGGSSFWTDPASRAWSLEPGGVPPVSDDAADPLCATPPCKEAAARDVPRDAVVVRSADRGGDTAGSPRRKRRVPAVPGRARMVPTLDGVRAELSVAPSAAADERVSQAPCSVEELGGERGLDGALCAGSHRLELGPERLGSLVGVELDLEVLGAAHLDGDVRVLLAIRWSVVLSVMPSSTTVLESSKVRPSTLTMEGRSSSPAPVKA